MFPKSTNGRTYCFMSVFVLVTYLLLPLEVADAPFFPPQADKATCQHGAGVVDEAVAG